VSHRHDDTAKAIIGATSLAVGTNIYQGRHIQNSATGYKQPDSNMHSSRSKLAN
jgi:hypothetical protein